MALESTEQVQSLPKGRTLKMVVYDTIMIVATAITAYALAFFGYIPFDPITATISGCIVGLVYVGFHNFYGATVWRRSWATIKERKEAVNSSG